MIRLSIILEIYVCSFVQYSVQFKHKHYFCCQNIMNTFSLSEARKNLSQLIQSTHRGGDQFTISISGKKVAVVMSIDDYEGFLETIEILQDRELVDEIAEAEKDYLSKNYKTLEEVTQQLALKNVPSSNNKPGRKRNVKTAGKNKK